MNVRKRTETIIETRQVQVVHRRAPAPDAWCDSCAATTPRVTADEAAVLARVSVRTIYRSVEAGEFHVAEPPDGALLICLPSLLAARPLGIQL